MQGGLREENVFGSWQSDTVGCSGESCDKQVIVFANWSNMAAIMSIAMADWSCVNLNWH